MVICNLKNGIKMDIKKAEEVDTKNIIEFIKKINRESPNSAYKIDDILSDEEIYREFIKEIGSKEGNVLLIGIIDGEIVGSLNFSTCIKKRFSHRGELGIAVLKDYWGIEIGTSLMNYFFKWAAVTPIKKVELQVREDNCRAINLYIKFGFKMEGRISMGLNVSGKYYDIYLMGKTIGQVI